MNDWLGEARLQLVVTAATVLERPVAAALLVVFGLLLGWSVRRNLER